MKSLPINDDEPTLIKSNFTLSEHYFKIIVQEGRAYEDVK